MNFSPDEDFARQLDADDPLRRFRERFHIPPTKDGQPYIYLVGNSLGLMPKATRAFVDQELDDWATLAVDAHLEGSTPWYSYHETLREPAARLVGARPHEVVCMNSLTVNLHLLMATFYRPTKSRFKILMEEPAFPSDTYAVKSQIAYHGFAAKEGVVLARAREGEFAARTEDIEETLEKHGDEIALVLLAGVNFFTGQFFDIARVTAAAHKHGCMVGIDLAHAVGNVPLALHDWDVDFAAWCSYKYLNCRPGRRRRRIRPRAPRDKSRAPAIRRLVGQRSGHAVPDAAAARVRAGAVGRLMGDQQPADLLHGAVAFVLCHLRRSRRHGSATRKIGEAHRLPRVPARSDRLRCL
jgi:kynureninase